MKVLKHDIRLMKWSNLNRPAYIFAQAHTIKGKFILLLKGYRSHRTIFGVIMRKDITRLV
jgi:hypothetical protein